MLLLRRVGRGGGGGGGGGGGNRSCGGGGENKGRNGNERSALSQSYDVSMQSDDNFDINQKVASSEDCMGKGPKGEGTDNQTLDPTKFSLSSTGHPHSPIWPWLRLGCALATPRLRLG